MVGQLARIKGCQAIGSAGSDEKVRFLLDELGFDAAFNYKETPPHQALRQAAPDGIDIYFDNVGGDHLQAAINRGRRSVNMMMQLRVPKDVVDANVAKRMVKGKPGRRPELIHYTDYSIVRRFQAEYRGLHQYYLMASNIAALTKYHWVMRTSLLNTLANKHKTTRAKLSQKLTATTETPYGPMKVLRVIVQRGEERKPLVAELGGIPFRKQPVKELRDMPYQVWDTRSELVTRLLKQECEMCGRTNVELAGIETRHVLHYIEAHHKRKLADIQKKGRRELPDWKKRMIAMRRKTLMVCIECHDNIHAGRPCRPRVVEESMKDIDSGEPDTVKAVSPVLRGADGKGT